MALTMFALATRRKPSANSMRRVIAARFAAAISSARAARRSSTARRSSGNGKSVGRDFAQTEIHVGHGQRSAATIAGRTRIGAGAVGPDDELYAVEAADRAAAGRHGFDGHHRSHDADARLFGFVFQFVAAVESRRRRCWCLPCRNRSPDRNRPPATREKPTTPPAGPERMLSLPTKLSAPTSPPADVMIRNAPPASASPQLSTYAPQHRIQIGVHHRGIAARDDLHQRRNAAAKR